MHFFLLMLFFWNEHTNISICIGLWTSDCLSLKNQNKSLSVCVNHKTIEYLSDWVCLCLVRSAFYAFILLRQLVENRRFFCQFHSKCRSVQKQNQGSSSSNKFKTKRWPFQHSVMLHFSYIHFPLLDIPTAVCKQRKQISKRRRFSLVCSCAVQRNQVSFSSRPHFSVFHHKSVRLELKII